jgi:hypothetical protein
MPFLEYVLISIKEMPAFLLELEAFTTQLDQAEKDLLQDFPVQVYFILVKNQHEKILSGELARDGWSYYG